MTLRDALNQARVDPDTLAARPANPDWAGVGLVWDAAAAGWVGVDWSRMRMTGRECFSICIGRSERIDERGLHSG
jgi:hypothetical protein